MLQVTTLYLCTNVMAGKQTLIDHWIPQAKKSKLDEPSASEVLASSSTTNDLVADASALDSTGLAADIPTLQADTNSSHYHGADMPTSEVSGECDVECCKEGYTRKPFQASNQSIILRTRKHQGSKVQ